MKEKKLLFDKPMDELREAFIRARFAQADVFGRADVEEWIKAQYENEVPPNSDTAEWRRFLACEMLVEFIGSSVITFLCRFATTDHELGLSRHESSGNDPIFSLASRGLYWGNNGKGIFLYPNPENVQVIFLVRENTPKDGSNSLAFERVGPTNRAVASQTVLEILFAEWWRGNPKRDAARQCLCEAAEVEIKDERMKAEADFDSAVAVSADGTKIVHADWVVVRDEDTNQRVRVFRSEQFRTKALRLDRRSAFARRKSSVHGLLEKIVTPETITPQAIAEITRRAMWIPHTFGPWPMGFIDCDVNERNIRIYYSITDLCPFPLPEGGVEVKVY